MGKKWYLILVSPIDNLMNMARTLKQGLEHDKGIFQEWNTTFNYSLPLIINGALTIHLESYATKKKKMAVMF